MPKATLTFNLPEERAEYRLANRAGELSLIIWEFTQLLREKTKYAQSDAESLRWDPVKEEWWKLLGEYNYDPHEE